MKRMDTLVGALSLSVIGLSGVALAQINPGGYPPGWEYGRLNCGALAQPPILTYLECVQCCNEEYFAGSHTLDWLEDCIHYCNFVVWENWA